MRKRSLVRYFQSARRRTGVSNCARRSASRASTMTMKPGCTTTATSITTRRWEGLWARTPSGLPAELTSNQYAPNPVEWSDPLGLAKRTYQTYTKVHPTIGEVYSGRKCGCGLPEDNVAKRDSSHHIKGYGPAVLDKSSETSTAIRGRQQQFIDVNGKAKSVG